VISSGKVERAQLTLVMLASIQAEKVRINEQLMLKMSLFSKLACAFKGRGSGELRDEACFTNYDKAALD
jgi:hypothetical protein